MVNLWAGECVFIYDLRLFAEVLMQKYKWLSILTVLLFGFAFLTAAQETQKEKIKVEIKGLKSWRRPWKS